MHANAAGSRAVRLACYSVVLIRLSTPCSPRSVGCGARVAPRSTTTTAPVGASLPSRSLGGAHRLDLTLPSRAPSDSHDHGMARARTAAASTPASEAEGIAHEADRHRDLVVERAR